MSEATANDWKACPPGELGRLSARLRSRRIRRNGTRSGLSIAAVLLLTIGLGTLRHSHQKVKGFDFAGIKCSKVMVMAPDYSMGTLDPQLKEQIKSHVEQCPRCHEKFKAMGLITLWVPAHPFSPGALDAFMTRDLH
ncbi:MAG: zf-HC2 domain-containing protein [Isosphaeraceae bacterium]